MYRYRYECNNWKKYILICRRLVRQILMGFLKYSQNFLGEHPPLFENLSVIPLVHKCGSVCFIVFPLLSGILPLVLFSILPSTSPTLCVPLSQTETKLEVCDSSVLESLILFTAGSISICEK